MLPSERGKNVRGIETGIVTKLPRNNLQGFGKGTNDQLTLALDRQRMFPKEARYLHLDGATTGHDRARFEGPLHHHEGIVDAALTFGNELLATTAKDDGRRELGGTVGEDIEALVTDALLLEATAGAQDTLEHIVGAGLDGAAGGLGDALEVAILHPAGAEQTAVGKVLRRQIADGELAEDDVGPAVDAGVELVVDDLPLGVDDALVLAGILDADLGVLLLGLELELDVEEEDLGMVELLGHLLEAGVGEGLLEGDAALDEEGLADVAARDALDGDEAVEVVEAAGLVEGFDGIDDHGGEQVLVGGDELGVEGRAAALEEHLGSLGGGGVEGDAQLLDLLDGKLPRRADVAHDNLRMDSLLHEGFELLEYLPRQQNDRRRTIPNLGVLAHANVHERLGGRVGDLQELHDGRPVVADGHLPPVEDELVHPPGAEGRPDGVGHRLARVDVANQLGLALRGVGSLAEEDNPRSHHLSLLLPCRRY
mmetsp:Transcript_22640/g.65168  ORF Transcript_22640/g.65168 Transcript_22640/m.65168 type:complete len:482 (+) Transcript_22640:434-1879(+)